MSETHLLLRARLETVRADLLEAMDHAEGIGLDWAPHAGMRTLGGQFAEILVTEVQGIARLKGEPVLPFVELSHQLERASVAEYRESLLATRNTLLEVLDQFTPYELDETVDVDPDFWEGMGLTQVSRAELIRSYAAHEWYHVGQIVSYLWFLGRDPYDW